MGQKVDVTRAAEMSGMSVSWWRQRIFRKQVAFHKVGRRIILDTDTITELLERCRVRPESDLLTRVDEVNNGINN